jgi:trimethylamine:corrinoid methyltransferase-like protein
MKWFRKEAYMPGEVIERGTLDEWRSKGKKDAATRAAERVAEILGSHMPMLPDDGAAARIEEIMTEEARKAGMAGLPRIE